MYTCTVSQLKKETGYSKTQIITACRRAGVGKIGKQFVITSQKMKSTIIKEIENRRPGNPNLIKKNKKL